MDREMQCLYITFTKIQLLFIPVTFEKRNGI